MTSPRNIIITGASSGLGAALAFEYAGMGMAVGLVGRNAERLEIVAKKCRDKGSSVITGVIDLRDAALFEQWFREFDLIYPVDLCIANAGISGGTGGDGEGLTQIQNIFDVNVSGVFNTIHPVIDRMLIRNKGQIAIVSSIAGFRGSPTAPAYSASKAAVRIYGQALRGLYASQNIKINVICPGFIHTPMTAVNPFKMPFIMNSDKAAGLIKTGLLRNKALIAFPWPMYFLAKLQNYLPDALIDRLYRSIPAKPSN